MAGRSCLFLLLFVVFSSLPAFGQTVGSIEGRVADTSGGVLPGATVQATNEDTGITRTLVADDRGRYRARDLSLGTYRVEASLQGFQTVVRRGVVLTIGRDAVVNLDLPIGEISEQVVVTGDAPLVETRSGGMTALVTREQMADLPLNARDFSQLISLQAGTSYYRGAEGSFRSGYGARISVSGARPTSNVFTLDGSEIQTAHGQLPSGVTGATLGLEAVQEFKILTSNYSAQYGRSAGATIVAATRSGTNALHGSLYWYHRNDDLDARNFFDRDKPEFKRNQFGASAGGPIVRDRTFFFANFEGLRERLPRPLIARVPTAQARLGILPDRTVVVHAAVGPYLNLWPLPTGRDFGDGTAEYHRSGKRPTDQDYVSARVDHHFSPSTSVFARYTIDESDQTDPMDLGLFDNLRRTRNQYVTVEERSVFSARFINQVRVSFTRTLVGSERSPVNPPDPGLSFFAGRPFGSIAVSGLTPLSGGESPRKDIVNAGQLHNDASFEAGRHSIRFGGAVTLFQYNKLQFSREGGDWEFGSIVDFLQNQPPRRLRIMGFNADPHRTFLQRLVALYVQDDISMPRNVTVNLGVRFEYLKAPTERHGRLANLRSIADTAPTVGEPYYQNPGGFFSPRIGVAWDPTGGGKTSVRTGFGVFHEPLLMRYYINSMDRQPPFWSDVDPAPGNLPGLFPNLNPHLRRLSEGPQAVHVMEFHPHNPYAMQWSLSVQRMLAASLVAEVGYTGSRGVHLAGRKEYAVPNPTFINGETFYPPNADFFNPSFTRLNYYDTSASSRYHALKATVTKRYAAGLHFQGAYTWSKAMDTQSATLSGELDATAVMDPFKPERDWGPAEFHVGHTFTGSFGYHLPGGTGLQGLAGGLVRGWQVSGIFVATTGTPFSVQSNGALTHPLNRGTSRPNLVAGGNNNPVLGGPDRYFDASQFQPQRLGFYGNVGRNTLRGPGFVQLDLSVIKEQPLGGQRTVQFRAEFFNLLNRANFGLPAATLFDSRGRSIGGAGRITRTVTNARQIQLALRFGF